MGTRQDHENQAIEDLRSYGRSLAGTVSTGRTEAVVGRALSAKQRPHRPRRLVLALTTLGLLAISNVGLAAVVDTAAPGDLLYPLDRGYERAGDLFGGWLFGVGDRTQERLAESEALNLAGDTEEAIAFLRDELTGESSDASLLVAAIDKLESQGNQGSQNDSGPASPAETAPGLVDDEGNGQNQPNPSDTAPGNGQDETGGSPSDTAPGQNKDNGSKDNPSDDAPGQNPATTTTSVASGNGNGNGNGNGSGNGNGNGNGNNGQGNDGP